MKSIDVIHCLFGLILLEFLYGRLSIEKAHMDFLLSKWRKKYFYRILRYQRGYIPYPRHCSPGVLFFNMGFWVGVNSKNPPKSGLFKQKVGVYSRKTPKTRLFTLPGAQFKSGAAMTRIRYLFEMGKLTENFEVNLSTGRTSHLIVSSANINARMVTRHILNDDRLSIGGCFTRG